MGWSGAAAAADQTGRKAEAPRPGPRCRQQAGTACLCQPNIHDTTGRAQLRLSGRQDPARRRVAPRQAVSRRGWCARPLPDRCRGTATDQCLRAGLSSFGAGRATNGSPVWPARRADRRGFQPGCGDGAAAHPKGRRQPEGLSRHPDRRRRGLLQAALCRPWRVPTSCSAKLRGVPGASQSSRGR